MPPSNDRDDDRRNSARKKSFKGATVIFNNRNSVVSGLIRDFSEAGGKFVVSAPIDLPPKVQIRFPDGQEHEAVIIWQHGKTEFGLQFVKADKS